MEAEYRVLVRVVATIFGVGSDKHWVPRIGVGFECLCIYIEMQALIHRAVSGQNKISLVIWPESGGDELCYNVGFSLTVSTDLSMKLKDEIDRFENFI